MGTSVQSRASLSDMFVHGGANACTLPAGTECLNSGKTDPTWPLTHYVVL